MAKAAKKARKKAAKEPSLWDQSLSDQCVAQTELGFEIDDVGGEVGAITASMDIDEPPTLLLEQGNREIDLTKKQAKELQGHLKRILD